MNNKIELQHSIRSPASCSGCNELTREWVEIISSYTNCEWDEDEMAVYLCRKCTKYALSLFKRT